MNARKTPTGASCAGAIALTDIAEALGWPQASAVATRAAKEGLTAGTDWRGRPALGADDAAWLFALVREEALRDSEEQALYREYMEERRKAAEQQRREDARKSLDEEKAVEKRRGWLAEKTAKISGRDGGSAAEEAGNPVSFAEFLAGKR